MAAAVMVARSPARSQVNTHEPGKAVGVQHHSRKGKDVSDLIARLAAPAPSRKPAKSVMTVWVESRPDSEQAAILTAAINPEWGHVALLEALTAEGAPKMSDTAFRIWRKGQGLA